VLASLTVLAFLILCVSITTREVGGRRQAGRQAGRQADRQAGRQVGRQTDRQTGRQAGRHTGKYCPFEQSPTRMIFKAKLWSMFFYHFVECDVEIPNPSTPPQQKQADQHTCS
jgi:hypothetical protein